MIELSWLNCLFMQSDNNTKKQAWWQPALELFAQISGWLVVPIVAALFLGKWLDQHFDTKPFLFFGCLAAAFFVTMIGLVKQSISAMKKMDKGSEKRQ